MFFRTKVNMSLIKKIFGEIKDDQEWFYIRHAQDTKQCIEAIKAYRSDNDIYKSIEKLRED